MPWMQPSQVGGGVVRGPIAAGATPASDHALILRSLCYFSSQIFQKIVVGRDGFHSNGDNRRP